MAVSDLDDNEDYKVEPLAVPLEKWTLLVVIANSNFVICQPPHMHNNRTLGKVSAIPRIRLGSPLLELTMPFCKPLLK